MGEKARLPLPCSYRSRRLHHLRHEAVHGLCGFTLLLPGGVGVGSQGEARVVVAQHTADDFHVHAVLQAY